MADNRTYIRVHDGLDEHHKIEGLSDAAFRLLVTCWCYSSRNLNDGRITLAAWKKRGTPKARRELIDAGLVELHDEHVQMHDYLEHQRSAAEVAELKRARAEAGSRGGKNRAKGQANAKQVLEQNGSKTQASTEAEADTEEEHSVEGGSLVRSGSPVEPPLYSDRCKKHGNNPAPGNCGNCADVRKANQQRPRPLTLVTPSKRCIVHDQSYTNVCSGCRADQIARDSA